MCPATTLANSLIPKEKALARYETNSINTKRETKAKGQIYKKNLLAKMTKIGERT